MANTFDQIMPLLLKDEGGFVNHPLDPGKMTNLGITQGTLSNYIGRQATIDDMQALTPQTVTPIYRDRYWNAIQGDRLPVGLDYAVFDMAVNSGPERAIKMLQRSVGVPEDGILGEGTFNAIAQAGNPQQLAGQYIANRRSFLQSLPTYPTFGEGWEKRLNGLTSTLSDWRNNPPVNEFGQPNPPTRPLDQTLLNPLQFTDQIPFPRPQFENDAFNTPSEDSGRGTKPTLLDDLNAQPAYGGVHDPNLGVFPKDADTTGGVSDPNDYTRRITEALMKEYMPGEYGRKTQTTPTWTPEPGSEKGWERQPDPSMDFGLPDIGVNTPTAGPRYKYGTGMDFGLPDITNGAADLPVANGAPAFLSYNDQYKQRTGQDYYNPYYEATKAQQTYADGAYDGSGRQVWGGYVQGNDGLWVQPTPGGQTHTLPDIVPNGIPTTGPNYKYGTGMDFGLPDIANGQTMTAEQWKQAFPEENAKLATPDWGVGDAGFNTQPMTAEQWKTAFPQEAAKLDTPNWGVGDAGFGNIAPTSTFPNTNLSGSSPEPGSFSDFGMGSTTGAPINYATGNTGGTASLDLGGGTSPGFGDFGMGSTGTTGGFDAGDQGDATTTGGHTDYMNSARALDAFTAQQQAAAVAQRNAIDASIAAAAAQSNAWNPQYNLSNDFNRNIANLNSPFPQPFQGGFL